MTFSWDFNTATLLAIGVQIIAFIVYLVKINGKVQSAYELAEDAKKIALEAHEKISIQQASNSLYRESVARDYVDRTALNLMEEHLMEAITEVRLRLDKVIDDRNQPRRPRE